MTMPFFHDLQRVCTHVRIGFACRDPMLPGAWYETRDYGATYRHVQADQGYDQRPVTVEGTIHRSDRNELLIYTPFCCPRLWWHTLCAPGNAPDTLIVPIFFHLGRLFIGPSLAIGRDICPTCVALRLGQMFPFPQVFKALQTSQTIMSPSSETGMLPDILSIASLQNFITSSERLKTGELVSLSLTNGDASEHMIWSRVLPLPGDHPGHEVEEDIANLFGIPSVSWSIPCQEEENKRDLPVLSLFDHFVGPLFRPNRVPVEQHEPWGITGFATDTGALSQFTRWHPDPIGSGLSFVDDHARHASVGEAIERYSGNYIDHKRLVIASANRLEQDGSPYVPFEKFSTFTSEQEAAPHWPFAPYHPEESIPWIPAHPLGDQEAEVLLPAEAVFLNLTRVTGQPSKIPVPLAGIAAHTTQQAAQAAALLELVERDSVMRWWHGQQPCRQLIDLPCDLETPLQRGVPSSIKQWFLLLPTDMPAFVVAGCLYDRESSLLVTGFAARPTLSHAVRKAVAEAWQLRRLSRALLDRNGQLWRDFSSGTLPIFARPYRADRRYRNEFLADFSNMTQFADNLQYFLDPSTHAPALARLSGEPCSYARMSTGEDIPPDEIVRQCVTYLAKLGERAYFVDLTTPDMRAGGYTVVRVISPGLVGNTATAFVPVAHPRLQEALRESGKSPYLAPLPHA